MHAPPLVLVVDDQEPGRFVKVQLLRRAGFNVHAAATGGECLSMAAELKPDVIILDVNLPDINGVEVCSRLRAQKSDATPVQILQLSSSAITTADRIRGLEHGADIYLTEPIDPDLLIATVRAQLRVRRAEEALEGSLTRERAARNLAEEASRLKDEFLATLSHELRTPLNASMGWIWQLRHSTLDETARLRALDSLERNAKVQAQLINDLLDISRVSRGKLHLKMQRVDLARVIDDAVDAVKTAADDKRLRLSIAAPPGCIVAGDHARLQQVITNLLTNAVQFTPEGGLIDLTFTTTTDSVVVSIHDTGVGIDAAFLPHVFDQFRQGKGGLSRKHGGLGLGLSVVRQLMDLHGGSVEVASDGPGAGTTFRLSLPYDKTIGDQADDTPLLTGTTVLIVHPDAHDLAAVLEASGALAITDPPASSPEIANERGVDVILSDADVAHQAGVPIVAVGTVAAGQLVRNVMAAHHPIPGTNA